MIHDLTDEQTKELIQLVKEWYRAREALSSDCYKLGISGHTIDTLKWADELSKRCQPLRDWCSKNLNNE